MESKVAVNETPPMSADDIAKLAENNKNFVISVSHTTRKPRPNEINGKDYYFINKNVTFNICWI